MLSGERAPDRRRRDRSLTGMLAGNSTGHFRRNTKSRQLLLMSAVLISACKTDKQSVDSTAASTTPPATTHTMAAPNAQMQSVLDKLASLGGKPIESLTPQEARKQPTPTDAVKALMTEKG